MIETQPVLDDGTPFPTLWWLSCKTLVAEVGRLEAGGLIEQANRRLAEDPAFRGRLESATERLIERRDGRRPDQPPRHPGGGPGRVKCLHAHLAHFLMTGDNPVGALVAEELSRRGVDAEGGPRSPCV